MTDLILTYGWMLILAWAFGLLLVLAVGAAADRGDRQAQEQHDQLAPRDRQLVRRDFIVGIDGEWCWPTHASHRVHPSDKTGERRS